MGTSLMQGKYLIAHIGNILVYHPSFGAYVNLVFHCLLQHQLYMRGAFPEQNYDIKDQSWTLS